MLRAALFNVIRGCGDPLGCCVASDSGCKTWNFQTASCVGKKNDCLRGDQPALSRPIGLRWFSPKIKPSSEAHRLVKRKLASSSSRRRSWARAESSKVMIVLCCPVARPIWVRLAVSRDLSSVLQQLRAERTSRGRNEAKLRDAADRQPRRLDRHEHMSLKSRVHNHRPFHSRPPASPIESRYHELCPVSQAA